MFEGQNKGFIIFNKCNKFNFLDNLSNTANQNKSTATAHIDVLHCLSSDDTNLFNSNAHLNNALTSATKNIPAETLLNFFNVMKQAELQMPMYQQNNLITPKQEEADDMIASSSSEILREMAATPEASLSTFKSTYVDVELERRKLAMIEKFQVLVLF